MHHAPATARAPMVCTLFYAGRKVLIIVLKPGKSCKTFRKCKCLEEDVYVFIINQFYVHLITFLNEE